MSKYDEEKKASGKTEVTSAEIYDPSLESIWTRLGLNFESFKPAPATTKGIVTHGDIPIELDLYDNGLLQQKMKPRHLQMIAAGGAIGTGLFVGTGGALATGGPAGIVLGWLIMGLMVVNVSGSNFSRHWWRWRWRWRPICGMWLTSDHSSARRTRNSLPR